MTRITPSSPESAILPGTTSAMGVLRAVARNSTVGFIGFFVLKGLSFAYGVAIVRQLGEVDFGRYSTVAALIAVSTIFAELGTGAFASRSIALDRSGASRLIGNLIAIRVVLSTVTLVLNVTVAALIGFDNELVGWVTLSSLAFFLYAIHGPCLSVLRGYERLDYTTSFTVIQQVVLIVTGGALLWLGWGVTGVIVAGSLSVAVTAGLAWRSARRIANLAPSIDVSIWPRLLMAGLPFAVTIFATSISFRMDTLILSWWRPDAEIGWYNVGYGLALSLVQVFTSLTVSFIPTLSRLRLVDRTVVDSFVARVLELAWVGTLPLAVVVSIFAEALVTLVYGDRFAPVASLLQIVIWVVPVLTLTSLLGNFTTVLHLEHSAARINTVNAALNVGLNVVLIPTYGVLAAATMTVITEVVCLAQYAMLLRGQLRWSSLAASVLGPPIGSLLLAGILLTWRDLTPLVSLPLGGLAYLVTVIGAAVLLVPAYRSQLGQLPRLVARA